MKLGSAFLEPVLEAHHWEVCIQTDLIIPPVARIGGV